MSKSNIKGEVMAHILIIEDDKDIANLLQLTLKHKYEVTIAHDGKEGYAYIKDNTFDLILLDLMMPYINGETLLGEIKAHTSSKVIIITAKHELEHKVNLLTLGADDYITKPFYQEEVLARVMVQLRNVEEMNNVHIHRGLKLDEEKREVNLNNQIVQLTNSEFDILSVLMKNPEVPLSKQKIYNALRNGTYVGDDNTISVHVSNIRKKFNQITDESYIKTVWGIGFMLE
ncbi:response regulator transcription factor [Macrococcus armenti]|uniref:response regulator transcription factor n=2 Tax=Macrococcus armenti TaxID=2875764 RepID=UPI001CC95798|nr:response regulator transcription factor [Macrococcus armenti]UBH08326.1 response regulator transcription factor [Macrococcus armenti]UBH10557.1 response regulator transcription factor [Macrococcus armenti]UBH15093.1 response regulator transcription factor [Macrococcus armenti]UBH17454.1 response regulator transcription factor [Macrococcus armenti]